MTRQVGAAITVLTATQLGLSVSTTHCLVGAIAGTGLADESERVNAATLQRIIASWVITFPAGALFGVLALLLTKLVV